MARKKTQADDSHGSLPDGMSPAEAAPPPGPDPLPPEASENKSELIRQFLAFTPGAKAKEVIDELAKRGVTISAQNYYAAKRSMGEAASGKRKPAAKGKSVSGLAAQLQLVRDAVEACGGLDELIEVARIMNLD